MQPERLVTDVGRGSNELQIKIFATVGRNDLATMDKLKESRSMVKFYGGSVILIAKVERIATN